ncbi:MAG: GHKL domain-containing protein [Flavobacterium sp.]|uniref:ATP-binding protein n=1 Tax=Flavobacterium sp. TaxID=239 RepID=UPI001B12318B|nr:ATP-binding protein [Flavobacterium sp.]MBO9586340.1 GHKL domain-containing protein [Flavobacterium sp.]
MNLQSTEEELREKIKELSCLYEISKTISKSSSINIQTLYDIIVSVKNAWRYCADCVVELHIKDYHLSTSEEMDKTVFQSSTIIVNQTNYGHIKVHYPATKYNLSDFSSDEQQLLDTIAIEIGNYVDKYQILERKAALRRTIERIERLSLLGEMTAGIAHELNTPLGNILGFAELIKEENSNSEIDADISIVINSVIYAREIVKKLMYFSCEMPQKLELQKLKPIIIFALSFLKSNFQKKSIRHELVFKDENIIAKIDSVQITQVLFNLLINAIYASPEKSTIKIIVDNDESNLYLKIEDSGTGIPDSIKQKIFEPFFSTKPVNYGCGLGLSVVHGIVKNHNGEITLQDNFPNGSIFTIRIPVTGAPGAAATCSLNITIAAQPVSYTTNCAGITTSGTYAPGTAMTASNTMTIPVNVTYVGAYNISTNSVNGISFSGNGTFASTGSQNVILTATGTPTSGGTFSYAITANSTNGSTACNKSIVFAFRTMKLLGLGENLYQPATASTSQAGRAILASAANFGPTGTVQVQGITIINGAYNTGTSLKNLINSNNIDIIYIGYNYNTNDATTLTILSDFVKNKKGVLIQAQENGNTGLATLINSICGSALTASDINSSGATYINPLANIADPILNGPFGNIQGLSIGGDNNNSYYVPTISNIVSLATISGNTSRISTFRHNTLGYLFCGDGGMVAGNSTDTSTTIYPAKISATGLPLSKAYTSSTTVYNSIFYANTIAWAIQYVQNNTDSSYVIP